MLSLLENPNPKLRYAIIPLISIVCSTLRGVEYVTYKKNMCVIQKVIKVMFTFTQDYALIKKWIGDSKVLSGFATEMFGKINSNSYIFGT